MGMFFPPVSAALDAVVVSKDDKGNIEKGQTFYFTVNANSSNKNALANTNDTSLEQSSYPGAENMRDMSPPFTPCRDYFDEKLVACMDRLPRELYQKILRTINDEEVDYYYKQLNVTERRELIAKHFTLEEWADLSAAKPQFAAKIDACKK